MSATKRQVYKLYTPFGTSLHETDEADGRIYVPTSIMYRCAYWTFFNVSVTIKRLQDGAWHEIYSGPARFVRNRLRSNT